MRRLAVAAVTLACAAGLTAGCTSSGPGNPSEAPPITVGTSSAIDSVVPTDSAVPTDPAPSTTAPSSTAASSSTPAPKPSTSAVAGPPACTAKQLMVRVLRGGAIAGQELAGITFTNSSSATCSLFGYPGVSLLVAGKPLGKPADRSSKRAALVTLKAGETAETQVTVFSTCNAPLSDTIRVYPPNLKTFVDRPMELRGCRTVVDPVTHQ